jgi:hypothetical protein
VGDGYRTPDGWSVEVVQLAAGERLRIRHQLQRAAQAVDTLRDVVAVRRSQAHAAAAPESLKAATRLGIRLTGDQAQSWDEVRLVTIEAIYALTDELDAT